MSVYVFYSTSECCNVGQFCYLKSSQSELQDDVGKKKVCFIYSRNTEKFAKIQLPATAINIKSIMFVYLFSPPSTLFPCKKFKRAVCELKEH